jgi:hypothetical protein
MTVGDFSFVSEDKDQYRDTNAQHQQPQYVSGWVVRVHQVTFAECQG